ncbi:MAG: hypothetical protein DMG70_27260 [Acidobacteria bacterium]|nr:MAG: hypothetical protein DMG70_27260 [Acidobacteriota bacterium]PYY08991.1 MAG: hypothetical protein DMG69_12260 [Acidobacteriota bacterium]
MAVGVRIVNLLSSQGFLKANRAGRQKSMVVRLLDCCLDPGRFCATLDTMLPINTEPLVIEQGEPGILRLRGPLTMENLSCFQSALRRGNAPILFLDLSEVPYMDSAGLGSLVSAHISVQKTGRRVVLTGVNDRIGKLFEITRVESLFLTFPSLPEAFDALLKSGRA